MDRSTHKKIIKEVIKMSILVTGGAGFIGSHTCVELLNSGKEIIVVDDFSNSKPHTLENIKKITHKDFKSYAFNILEEEKLEKVFQENKIEAVINFAGFKAVGESVKQPLKYYHNNMIGMLLLLEMMQKHNVKKIIFSSSATVYGPENNIPYIETMKTGVTSNPYGKTKYMIEEILKDLYQSDPEWDIAILRYFNPIGAHESGLLGDDPQGIPNNLMPYITRVACGVLPELSIFGNDYETQDGTCQRDYIHVVDLGIGHVKALEKLEREQQGVFIYNLSTGIPYSVLDIVNTFATVNQVAVPYYFAPRREGDLPAYYANVQKAETELGFKTQKTLDDMCRDSWNFQKMQS